MLENATYIPHDLVLLFDLVHCFFFLVFLIFSPSIEVGSQVLQAAILLVDYWHDVLDDLKKWHNNKVDESWL